MGSVAVRAIAQNCRCMRIIEGDLIEYMMAKESDIDGPELYQERVPRISGACFRISRVVWLRHLLPIVSSY